MSHVVAAPDFLSTAAEDLAAMGSAVSTATAAAARSTTLLLAAGADDVSTHIAALFSTHGLQYQLASAQAAEFHELFVLTLAADANTYLTTEIANAQRCLAGAINAPATALLEHPLLGADPTASASTAATPAGAPRWRPRRQAPGLRSRGRTALLPEIPHRAALSGTGTPAGHSGAQFGVDPAGI